MGISNSKSKKRVKQTIIVNSNATDVTVDFISDKSDQHKPPDQEEGYKVPSVKWHKANPRQEILRIQQEAEIRDIETIYANSRIQHKDLLNLMPDHYWSGKENTLPRYVMYRGNYPESNIDKSTNLRRVKSSSLNDLTESISFYFNPVEDSSIENNITKQIYRSISCPHFNIICTQKVSKEEKDVPKKGILKNRRTNRPNSALIMDKRENQSALKKTSDSGQITEEMEMDADCSQKKKQKKTSIGKSSPIIIPNTCEEDIFSGYFDQSPSRIEEGPSLRVNVDKKKWIKTNLDKRLNLRPTSMDLANRNILHEHDENKRQNDFELTRNLLNEKLSERPTLTELKKQKIIKFSDFVEVQETDNYDRSVCRTWGRLTEVDKETIRNELNEFKDKEMRIHLRSKRFTKFHDSRNE